MFSIFFQGRFGQKSVILLPRKSEKMAKTYHVLILLLPLLGALTACIRDEALGTECDILGVSPVWLEEGLHAGFMTGNPVIKNASVTFFIKPDADVSALNPQFEITHSATLYKGRWEERTPFKAEETFDFSEPQTYCVVSEDGVWHKDYTVSFEVPRPTDIFSFECYIYDDKNQYQCLLQPQTDGLLSASIWASGNGGYAMTGMAKVPEDYPTVFVEGGVSGCCAKLETKNAGDYGRRASKPIAAGNLFIGEFQALKAMLAPLDATRFGLQIVKGEPATLSGYYRYKAGDLVINKDAKVLPEKHDTCDIYAVLYEVDPTKFVPLNGRDILSSPRIVSMARIDDPGEPSEWTYFEEPFKLKNGKVFDEELLRSGGYALAVVMTSSRQGAYFEGAIGSVLYVDEIKLSWK